MGQVISAGILLVIVVAIYIAVSYKHEKGLNCFPRNACTFQQNWQDLSKTCCLKIYVITCIV